MCREQCSLHKINVVLLLPETADLLSGQTDQTTGSGEFFISDFPDVMLEFFYLFSTLHLSFNSQML